MNRVTITPFYSGADCKPPKFEEQDPNEKEEEEEEEEEKEDCVRPDRENCSEYQHNCVKYGR